MSVLSILIPQYLYNPDRARLPMRSHAQNQQLNQSILKKAQLHVAPFLITAIPAEI